MTRIAVPHPDIEGVWLVTCQLKLSDECATTFYTENEFEGVGCVKCSMKEGEIQAAAEERRLDKEALTPDDHPETGFLGIMTEKEVWEAGWLSPDVKKKAGGRWT